MKRFMHRRLQTWFPLTIHVAINGREWLARQLDAASLGYRRSDNCFLELEDPAYTQELCDQQLKTRWRRSFLSLLHRYHPSHKEIFREQPLEYYWTLDQSECATDPGAAGFRSPETLGQLYPQLLRHAAYNFASTDVMRFLGRRLTSRGTLWGNFRGEVRLGEGRGEGLTFKLLLSDHPPSLLRNSPNFATLSRGENGGHRCESLRISQLLPHFSRRLGGAV